MTNITELEKRRDALIKRHDALLAELGEVQSHVRQANDELSAAKHANVRQRFAMAVQQNMVNQAAEAEAYRQRNAAKEAASAERRWLENAGKVDGQITEQLQKIRGA